MSTSPEKGDARPRLGWIGLGSMGLGMAKNLQNFIVQNADYRPLLYFNRTISRGEPLQQLGATPATSAKDVVQQSDIIFISLSDDAALTATVDSILDSQDEVDLRNKIIVDTTTIHPDTTTKVAERLSQRGARFVAGPVFGASPVAAEGKLLWVLAGDDEPIQAIEPFIVGTMGRGIIRAGHQPSQATLLKTAGNAITAGMMELIGEAHVFAEKTNLGTEAMESLIEHQYGPLALSMSKRLTTGAYMPARGDRPWSDLTLALKDVGHGVDCAEKAGISGGVAAMALENLKEADKVAKKKGRALDSSSMYGVLRQKAGLDFESDLVKERDAKATASKQ